MINDSLHRNIVGGQSVQYLKEIFQLRRVGKISTRLAVVGSDVKLAV